MDDLIGMDDPGPGSTSRLVFSVEYGVTYQFEIVDWVAKTFFYDHKRTVGWDRLVEGWKVTETEFDEAHALKAKWLEMERV